MVFIEEIYKHNAGIKHTDFLQSGLQILEGSRSIVYFVFGSADRRAGKFRLNGVSFAFSDRVTMTPQRVWANFRCYQNSVLLSPKIITVSK